VTVQLIVAVTAKLGPTLESLFDLVSHVLFIYIGFFSLLVCTCTVGTIVSFARSYVLHLCFLVGLSRFCAARTTLTRMLLLVFATASRASDCTMMIGLKTTEVVSAKALRYTDGRSGELQTKWTWPMSLTERAAHPCQTAQAPLSANSAESTLIETHRAAWSRSALAALRRLPL